MFQHRPKEFDTRVSAIAKHLRAIQDELGELGHDSGRRVSASASGAASRLSGSLSQILGDIEDWLISGRRAAADQAENFRSEAVKIGAKAGSDAVDRVSGEVSSHPIVTIAVAVAIGLAIGMATRRS